MTEKNKPLTTLRVKGHSLVVWPSQFGGYQLKLKKSFKKKGSTQWEDSPVIKYFGNEIELLRDLCNSFLAWQQDQEHSKDKGNAYLQTTIDEEDMPF